MGNQPAKCGQLWTRAAYWWNDPAVAKCRRAEAQSVCRDLFGLRADGVSNIDSHNIEEHMSGVSLFTLNAFGQEHKVTHIGFVAIIVVFLLLALVGWYARKRFKDLKRFLKGSPPAMRQQAEAISNWHPSWSPWRWSAQPAITDASRDPMIRLDPTQLHQLREMVAPAVRDRPFEEIRDSHFGTTSRPSASPGEDNPDTHRRAAPRASVAPGAVIDQIG